VKRVARPKVQAHKVIGLIIIISLILMGLFWQDNTILVTAAEEKENEETTEESIEVIQTDSEGVADYQTFAGFTVPGDILPVVPGTGGEVEELHVETGEQVQEGELLLELEAEELDLSIEEGQAALEQAKLELEMAETGARAEELAMAETQLEAAEESYELAQETYERVEYLYEEGVAPKSDLDEAEGTLIEAEAKLETAEQELAMAETGARPEEIAIAEKGILEAEKALDIARLGQDDLQVNAPASGVVAELDLSEGELIDGESMAMALLDLEEIVFEVEAPAERITEIATGQQAEVEFDSQPEDIFIGEVTAISPTADDDSGLFNFEITIPNRDLRLKAGEFGQARVQTGREEEGFWVPREAVSTAEQEDYIFVVRDQLLREVEITIQEEENDRFLITGDLNAGDLVAAEYRDEYYSGYEAELLEVISW